LAVSRTLKAKIDQPADAGHTDLRDLDALWVSSALGGDSCGRLAAGTLEEMPMAARWRLLALDSPPRRRIRGRAALHPHSRRLRAAAVQSTRQF